MTLRLLPSRREGALRRLLVFGATGATGQAIVRTALDEGHTVTAFVRSPLRLTLEHPRLSMVTGDVLDPGSVAAALPGQDAVICALGAPARNRECVRARGTGNIVRAMQASSINRLVVVSSHGIGESRKDLPAIMRLLVVPFYLEPAFRDHEAQERIVRESWLDWTLVRPVNLTNGPVTGEYRRGFGPGEKVKMKISRADVAEFVVGQISQPNLHETIPLSY